MRLKTLCQTIVFAVALCCCFAASALTVSVPGNYSTLEEAVAAATADSSITEIIVGKGDNEEYPVTYTVAAGQKVTTALTIRGASGNFKDVIISGGGKCYPFWLENSDAVLADLTVANGYDGGGNAGGVVLINGTMRNCRVTGCTGGDVGGIYVRYGTVVDCVVDNNSVQNHYYGGGIYMQKACLVERTVVTNNFCRNYTYGNICGGGTGVYINGGTLRNSVVAFNDGNKIDINYVQLTPAIGVYANGGTIENSTIYGNTCGNGAYAGFAGLTAISGVKIVNTLVLANGNPETGFVSDFSGDAATLDHTIINPPANQYRLNAAGVPEPVLGSTLVDAGVATETSATATDLVGNQRTLGAAVDVGAYEFVEPSELTVAIPLEQLEYVSLDPLNLTGVVAGDASALAYAWQASDERVVFSAPSALATQVTVPDFGRYTITFTATGGAKTAASSVEIVFRPSIVYVDSKSTGGVFPYSTKDAAAASIEAAAEAVAPGGEIVLVSGTRIVRETTLYLAGNLTIRGETGDFNDAIIDGNAACVPVRLSSGQTLANLTVTGGKSTTGAARTAGIENVGGTITNCHITANVGAANGVRGAGIFNDGGIVVDCLIDGNTSPNKDNGHYSSIGLYQCGSAALADRCIITNNIAAGTYSNRNGIENLVGIGATIRGGVLRNSIVAFNAGGTLTANTYPAGAGVQATDSARIENCTIIGNRLYGDTVVGSVKGLFLNGANTVSINNLVIGNGDPKFDGTVENIAGTGSCTHSFAYPLLDAMDATNIDATGADLVYDAAGLPKVKANSPFVDHGSRDEWMATAQDVYGKDRIYGQAVDIGAVEFHPAEFGCTIQLDRRQGLDSLVVQAAAIPEGKSEGAIYYWDFGDGRTETKNSAEPFTVEYNQPGDWKISLRAVNATGLEAEADPVTVQVRPSVMYVAAGGSASGFYATPETAANTIKAAVDAAIAGVEVRVVPDEYAIAETIEINTAITLKGIGKTCGETVLNGNDTVQIMKVGNPAAKVENLTFANGKRALDLYFGTVENCRFTGCKRVNTANAIYQTGGLVRNCTFDNCYWSNHEHFDGVAMKMSGPAARAENCVFTNNIIPWAYANWETFPGGVVALYDGAQLVNSLIADNEMTFVSHEYQGRLHALAVYAGGGATVQNCAIVSNRVGMAMTQEGGTQTECYTCALVCSGATVVNTLVADNFCTAEDNKVINHRNATAAMSYCATLPVDTLTGEGNIAADASQYFYNGRKFKLPAQSSLVNRGTTLEWHQTAVDLYGGKRLIGRSVDIGPVESRCSGLRIVVR